MKRIDLIPVIKECGIQSKKLSETLLQFIIDSETDSENIDAVSLESTLSKFISKIKAKLSKHNRSYSRL